MRSRSVGCAAFVLSLVLSGHLFAAETEPFSAVPDDAWMVVSCPDLPAAWEALAQTSVCNSVSAYLNGKFGDAPPAWRELIRQRKLMESELGFPLDMDGLVHIFAAADVLLLPSGPDQKPDSVVVLHAGDEKRARSLFHLIRQMMIDDVTSHGALSKAVKRETIREVEIVWTQAGSGAAMAEIAPGRFAFSSHPDAIRRLLEPMPRQKRLSADATFQIAAAGLEEQEPHGFLFLNAEHFNAGLGSRGGVASFAVAGPFRALGPGVVLAASFHIEPDAIRFEMFLPYNDPDRDPLAAVYRHALPAKLHSLDYVSSSPLFLTARNTLDGVALYDSLRAIALKSIARMVPQGEKPDLRVEAAEDQFRKEMGFSIKDDLAPGVGPEVFFSLEQVRFDPLVPFPNFEMAAGVQILDSERIERVLTGFTEFLDRELRRAGVRPDTGDPVQSASYEGDMIRWFPVPNVPVYALAYARSGGFVLAGLGPESVRRAIDRAAGKAKSFSSGYLQARLRPYLHEAANEVFVLNIQELIGIGREIVRRFENSDNPKQAGEARFAAGILKPAESVIAVGASTAGRAKGLHTRGAFVFKPGGETRPAQ